MSKVLVCTDFDVVNDVCLQEAWEDHATFPELSAPQTQELTQAILAVLVVAFIFRFLARIIRGK